VNEESKPGVAPATDFATLLADLGGGAFEQQINRAITDVALNVVTHSKKGQVTITLDMARIGDSNQMAISHKLAFTQPTSRGKRSEDTSGDTPVHVGYGGIVTIEPNRQTQMELGAGTATRRTDGVTR
jgi:hypothetical protein